MARRWGLVAATPAAVAGIALATLGASAGSSAGTPTAQPALLCGMWMQSAAVDDVSGNSNQDHVNGADVSGGQYYTYGTGNTSCQQEYNNGAFKSGAQTFTWKINHSNVDVQRERGTEHGLFTLQNTSAWAAGFQGQISNYDFATPLTSQAGDDNGTTTVYYTSGHPDGAGNFNTHGGAATGAHYRGTYGTVVYQDDSNNMSPCKKGSSNYCFQAILIGQVN
jgi:hypothetical protein